MTENGLALIAHLLRRAGFGAGGPRLPMVPADEDFKARFDPVMDRYNIDLPVPV